MARARRVSDPDCQGFWHRCRHRRRQHRRAGARRHGLYRGNRRGAICRDVRVTAIYEGTNGIQAMDLVARKLMDGGEAAFAILDEIEANAEAAKAALPDLAEAVWSAAETLRETTEWLVEQDLTDRFAGAVPYLRAFARVLGGHAHLSAAMAGDGARARLATFYINSLLPEHGALLAQAREGAADLMAISADDLGA